MKGEQVHAVGTPPGGGDDMRGDTLTDITSLAKTMGAVADSTANVVARVDAMLERLDQRAPGPPAPPVKDRLARALALLAIALFFVGAVLHERGSGAVGANVDLNRKATLDLIEILREQQPAKDAELRCVEKSLQEPVP